MLGPVATYFQILDQIGKGSVLGDDSADLRTILVTRLQCDQQSFTVVLSRKSQLSIASIAQGISPRITGALRPMNPTRIASGH